MKKIFWTIAKKKRLLKYSKSLTLEKLSLKFKKPIPEIEHMLIEVAPGKIPIVRVYYERIENQRVKITHYSSRPAYGAFINKRYETRNTIPT